MFIDESLNYHILEKTSNQAFQALWIEISFDKNKDIICGIIYRQHNSPDRFQLYFEVQSIENFTSFEKRVISLHAGSSALGLGRARERKSLQWSLYNLRSAPCSA